MEKDPDTQFRRVDPREAPLGRFVASDDHGRIVDGLCSSRQRIESSARGGAEPRRRQRRPRDHGTGDPFAAGPASWLVLNADLIPRGGRALDVACGTGRNALLLAATGLGVLAVDRDRQRIEGLRSAARRARIPLEAEIVDLEAGAGTDLGDSAYDLILVVHYLHRPLFPALARALRPGGILLYETFTVDQAARGKPSNPAYLLEHGELRRLVAPLEVIRERDGEFDGRMVAGVAARKPG